MHLREELDQLFKMYHKSFNDRSKILSKKLATDEDTVSYKDLSYKIFFHDKDSVRSHEIDFYKKMVLFITCGRPSG